MQDSSIGRQIVKQNTGQVCPWYDSVFIVRMGIKGIFLGRLQFGRPQAGGTQALVGFYIV